MVYYQTIGIWIFFILLFISLISTSIIALYYIWQKYKVEKNEIIDFHQHDYLRKIIKTSVIVRQQERNRIASDLHDSILGKLTLLRFKNHLNHPSDELDKLIEEIITETRYISHDLSPPMIGYRCISEVINDLINPWQEHFQVTYYKKINGSPRISQELKIQLIRILQELITNIYNHAKSDYLIVKLKTTSKLIALIISDKGIGFDINAKTSIYGKGLKNLSNRVKLLGGHYKIKSGKKGTSAILIFSINEH